MELGHYGTLIALGVVLLGVVLFMVKTLRSK